MNTNKIFLPFLIFLFMGIVLPFSSADETNKQYTVGPNDVLNISVLGYEDLQTSTPVASDGTISFPYIGSFPVQGLSISEIENKISKKLNSYIKYPVVAVSLAEGKSKNYFVTGEVVNPGRFLMEEDITILKAITTAGGITPEGLYGDVILKRKQDDNKTYNEIKIDLNDTKSDNATGDMPIEAGDIIVVGRNKEFFIYGEVENPGKFTLEDNITVSKAISLAGGITPEGLYGKIKVKRKQDGKQEYKIIDIDLKEGEPETTEKTTKETEDVIIKADDIIVVGRNKEFFVYGEVENPGKFTLEDNITVSKAISLAGGITPEGLYGKIKVKRKQDGKQEYKIIDIDLKEDDTGDISVQADDIVVVKRNKEFFVYGEVESPGKFTLESGMTVLKAISLAGGFSKFGSADRVKILRSSHDEEKYEILI